jgi:hypothetical protein
VLREVGGAFLRVVQLVGDFLLRAGGGYFGWVDVDWRFGGNVRSVWFFDLLEAVMVVVVLGCGGCLRAAGTPLPGGAWAARGVGDEGGV